MNLFALYLGTIFLIIATPGPSALLMIQDSSSYGLKRSLFNAFGSVMAAMILIALSLGGVAFLIRGIWIDVMAIAGAVLLIWVGINSLRPINLTSGQAKAASPKAIFKRAFYTGVSNPKDLIFFTTLLPQFILEGAPYWHSALYLATGWAVIDFSIMMLYALSSHIATKKITQSSVNKARAVTGALITVIGLTLFTKSVNHLL
ncbi:LysE family translocator [Halomonas faecis]|uniref:LysE family translocator n=1 Tax=Halomonas faecis TaxID=1562110 RepID=UPI0013D80DCA|nr:LysE family translocator [Halomonas faecis]